ncbi:MAG: hypothetical protein KatS3mg061_1946 [Dehalococcoidia bacterium]|nr:MAG: hypothetical protein KatS3mg061_1946 [Dehalococcoidia bacterium]
MPPVEIERLAQRTAVVIPAYCSLPTLLGTLRALGDQTVRPAEVVVVDSSPDEATARAVGELFPSVRLLRSTTQLLPLAARNRGVAATTAELIATTDPDAYPIPRWLERLLRAYERTGRPVAGGVACVGQRLHDRACHLRKFGNWLPAGPERDLTDAPTVNLLLPRRLIEQVGGFPPQSWVGDVLVTRRLARLGYPTRFVPAAVVYHHHLTTAEQLLAERLTRGAELMAYRLVAERWSRGRAWLWLALFPARYLRALARDFEHAARAGNPAEVLLTAPLAQAATLAAHAGEAAALWSFLHGWDTRP